MPDDTWERRHLDAGYNTVCGVDEAGRGPWAGPVVAAAAVVDFGSLPDTLLTAIDDSKKLSALKRQSVFKEFGDSIDVGIGIADVDEIDQLNILQATMLAMKRAVENLTYDADFALIDGNRCPDLGAIDSTAIVKGDSQCLSIAAASIAAKVTRDEIMYDLSKRYPGYGWERNAGYGTAEHQQALGLLGVTPAHRKSFAPIRKILGQESM
jgi:ribonuclease HII